MSSKLVRTGPSSPVVTSTIGQPTAVRISGDGLRAFHRSWHNSPSPPYNYYEGQINAVDWNGTSWSIVSGIGGSSGGSELYEEGNKQFQISKNGTSVAWDFKYQSPNTFPYNGISVSRQNFSIQDFYAFRAYDASSPSYASGIKITTSANETTGNIYQPTNVRFSNTATLFIHYSGYFGHLIEIESRSSLFFPSGGTYGDNCYGFEVSGNGNHVFVFIGGSLKLFSWDGSAWQFSNDFTTSGYIAQTGATAAVNYDGSIVAVRSSTATRVYKKTANTWAQLGSDLLSGEPWVNSAGNLVITGNKLFEWSGTSWGYKWDTLGALSDDGTVAVAASGPGSIIRYELKNVAPIYYGGPLVSSIYAGSTEGKQIYYGPQKLWP